MTTRTATLAQGTNYTFDVEITCINFLSLSVSLSLSLSLSIYIYICVCVCVCVCKYYFKLIFCKGRKGCPRMWSTVASLRAPFAHTSFRKLVI